MPQVGFETTNPVFELTKTTYASELHSAIVINGCYLSQFVAGAECSVFVCRNSVIIFSLIDPITSQCKSALGR
jgi:hypothetical protein